MSNLNNRNSLFDNIKSLMLILVVLGHTIDAFILKQDSVFRYIMQYIYLFHMPMFAFVTGYFSKNADKAREGAVKKVLIPYLVLQIAYVGVASLLLLVGAVSYNADIFQVSILFPTSPLYYLLAVFLWKVFLKDIDKMRFPIIFSVLAGVLISLIGNDQFHIGWGATFSLMLFFLLGYKCSSEMVEKIRKLPKLVGILILLLGIIPATVLPYNFRNVRFTYHYVGLENGIGMIYRLLFYVISVIMLVGIINLMPAKRTVFSKIGEHSIIVYAGSSFVAPFAYLLAVKLLPFDLAGMPWLNLICIIIFSTAVGFFFSMDWIKKIYDFIMKWVLKFLFRA